eukprot:358826-Chlamydomonas_euryale.AAC.13
MPMHHSHLSDVSVQSIRHCHEQRQQGCDAAAVAAAPRVLRGSIGLAMNLVRIPPALLYCLLLTRHRGCVRMPCSDCSIARNAGMCVTLFRMHTSMHCMGCMSGP